LIDDWTAASRAEDALEPRLMLATAGFTALVVTHCTPAMTSEIQP